MCTAFHLEPSRIKTKASTKPSTSCFLSFLYYSPLLTIRLFSLFLSLCLSVSLSLSVSLFLLVSLGLSFSVSFSWFLSVFSLSRSLAFYRSLFLTVSLSLCLALSFFQSFSLPFSMSFCMFRNSLVRKSSTVHHYSLTIKRIKITCIFLLTLKENITLIIKNNNIICGESRVKHYPAPALGVKEA